MVIVSLFLRLCNPLEAVSVIRQERVNWSVLEKRKHFKEHARDPLPPGSTISSLFFSLSLSLVTRRARLLHRIRYVNLLRINFLPRIFQPREIILRRLSSFSIVSMLNRARAFFHYSLRFSSFTVASVFLFDLLSLFSRARVC